MLESKIIELKNKYYAFFQNKFENIAKNSFILSKIDEIILFFIGLTLLTSTFLESEKIGVFAIIAIILTFVKLHTIKGSEVKLTAWDGAIVVYFIVCFISTINSALVPQSIHGFLKTVIYILYYFSVANYFQTNQNKIRYVFLFVAALCGVEALIALYQNCVGVEEISTWQDSNYINPEDAIARAYGTLQPYNPNLLGGYLIAGIPYAIGAVLVGLISKSKKILVFSSLSAVLCAIGIFVTGSRGAYLALAVVLATIFLLAYIILETDFPAQEKLKIWWKKSVTAIVGCVALVLIAVPKITKRILSIFILRGDSSTSFRMNVYNSSWHMFFDNWFLGIGAGNQTFREIYGLYMVTGFDALSTYSVPLEIAVESGICGLTAYVSFIGLFLYNAFKFVRLKDSPNGLTEKVVVCVSILTILGVMTHGLFDTIYFRPQVQFLFWTMIAMASSVLIKNKEV